MRFQASLWFVRPSNHISVPVGPPSKPERSRAPSELLLVVADVRLPLSPASIRKRRGTRGLLPLVGAGHGAALGGGDRGGESRAAAPRAHRALGRGGGPGAGLRVSARPRATSAGTLGPDPAGCAGSLPAAQPTGQRGAVPALGPQHPGCDAGRPWSGPGLGLLLPVPKPGAAAQWALLRLPYLHPSPGPPLPPAGPLRGLPQLPALPVSPAPRRGRPAACLCAAGPGPVGPAASPHTPPYRRPAPAALAHVAHRQSVSGTVRPGLRDRHVRGGCAVVWGRTALPRDAAAQGPDHVGVGSGPACVRPGPLPQPAGSSGAPLGPRLALALPGLPVAGGRHHLPDRSRCGTHGFLTPGSASACTSCTRRAGEGTRNSFQAHPHPQLQREAGWYLMPAFSNSHCHPWGCPCPAWTPRVQGLGPGIRPLPVAPEDHERSGKGLLGLPGCPTARLIKCPLGSGTPSSFVGFWSSSVAQAAVFLSFDCQAWEPQNA